MAENEISETASAFCQLYKNSGRSVILGIEERRQSFLREQKQKCNAAFDEMRDLSDLFPSENHYHKYNKTSKKPPITLRLMQAEWLTKIPDELSENWLVKICPLGLRYLVVAYKGITSCYLKMNKPSFKFKSKLPGGGSDTPSSKFTVLDCIYNAASERYLVYDVLAWNSMSLLNAEAQTRFFWLKSKFQEEPEMFEIDHVKNKGFELLDCFPAERSLLQEFLSGPLVIDTHELPCDSVLFYHKEGHYLFGKSPLVCWLKSFMLPEVLQIDVPELHLGNTPSGYVNVGKFLEEKAIRKKKKVVDVEMECL